MEKQKKRIRAIFWVVVVLACILVGMGLAASGLTTKMKTIVALICVAAVAVAAVVIDLAYYRRLGKAVDALLPLLHQDPDAYIQGIEELLHGAKNLGLRQTRAINLAAAYCEKGDYRQAAQQLESLDPNQLAPQHKGVYWADYALTQFHLHHKKKACDILTQQAQLFAPLENSRHLGGLLAVLEIFRLLAEGDQASARKMLDLARVAWPEDTVKSELDYLEGQC
jgi:tetratricopeptide (TPR) repeat protein